LTVIGFLPIYSWYNYIILLIDCQAICGKRQTYILVANRYTYQSVKFFQKYIIIPVLPLEKIAKMSYNIMCMFIFWQEERRYDA